MSSINPLSEPVAVLVSLFVLGVYHVYLLVRVRRDPSYTIQALLSKGRAAWIERVMSEKEGILAVQSLRNAIMAATFFASTSVVLIIGALTLVVQADKLAAAWNTLNPLSDMDEATWLVKLLFLLIDLLVAFGCFAQAIRLFSHVGILASVPVGTMPPAVVARLFVQAGRYHTRGMRCYYYAFPLLFWLFGPLFLVLASCALAAVLYRLDRSPVQAFGAPALSGRSVMTEAEAAQPGPAVSPDDRRIALDLTASDATRSTARRTDSTK